MGYLLGIDIGTSGTKTVLFDLEGKVVASSLAEYPLYQPQNAWAEQNPLDWWNATVCTIQSCLERNDIHNHDIKGIGISGQMHGLVLLDKDGEVLYNSIIWCDQRTAAQCDKITSLVGGERLIELTGNPALTGFTASKIMWIKQHRPDIYEKTRHILLPKDYIRFRLTGEFATEVSDASGMQLLDLAKRNWSDEVLAKLDIDRELLAKVYESYEISGKVSRKAAEITGLMEGTPVAGGGGDQAAGAIGNGIVKNGLISSTIGTSGVVFAHVDKMVFDPLGRVHTFCHAVPKCWHVMGVTQGAGLSLKWFRDNFALAEIETAIGMAVDPYQLMDKQAERVPAGSNGLLYLPYLMGERTPHLDPLARGVFFGLTARHGKKEFIRAVMEGVTFSLMDCLRIIEDMGVEIGEIRASGGGGKSKLWRQMQADIFNRDIVTLNASEGPALGVALLAGVGVGVYKNVEQACSTAVKPVNVEQPNPEDVAVYERYYPLYQSLYAGLKDEFVKLDKVES